MTNPEPHSVDILTHGRWVLVGNVQRWQGEHLELPKPKPVAGTPGICGCGQPTYAPRGLYCPPCLKEVRRQSWRDGRRRKRARAT